MGRTQLQDAVSMTLGQKFGTYAVMPAKDEARLVEATVQLHEIHLGAPAIGTGINAHPLYAESVRKHLSEISGIPLLTARNLIAATQDADAFVRSAIQCAQTNCHQTLHDFQLLAFAVFRATLRYRLKNANVDFVIAKQVLSAAPSQKQAQAGADSNRTYAKLSQQGTPTKTVRLGAAGVSSSMLLACGTGCACMHNRVLQGRLGGVTPLGRFCVSPI